jgi:hypothetical protein
MILSAVNFLGGKTRQGFSNYHDSQVLCDILRAKGSLEEQLEYALADPSFVTLSDHSRMFWLLNHPRVCKTSFEELVGPKGGGSAGAQARAIARVMDFLGATGRVPEETADQLFNPDAFSFYRGQVGAWREAFTPGLRGLADERFGGVLRLYGYE